MAQHALLALLATAALATAATQVGAQTPPPVYSATPNAPSDIYVQGKFDHTGTYVPPHYEARPKPEFHGYFNKDVEYKHGYFDKPKPKIKPKLSGTDADTPPN